MIAPWVNFGTGEAGVGGVAALIRAFRSQICRRVSRGAASPEPKNLVFGTRRRYSPARCDNTGGAIADDLSGLGRLAAKQLCEAAGRCHLDRPVESKRCR